MKKKNRRGTRGVLVTLCIVLGLVLTVMIGATIYANHLMSLVNRVEQGQEQMLSQEELDALLQDETIAPNETTAPVIEEDEIDWGKNHGQMIAAKDNITNILLIGQDAREPGVRARSDSMILVTFNKTKKTITLTSMLRDLYVKIPGYTDNKMNSAYPAGGMELLDEVIEVNFGVRVSGNVAVDFSQFAEVIDLLGGVDMELRSDEAGYINFCLNRYELSEGLMHLDGEQALTYSRIRYLDADADFSRTNRQRKVINALIEKFRDTKLTTLLGMLDELLPMITTDMSNAKLIALATEMFPLLADCTVVSQRIPADGEYSLATIRGMSCVVADMDAARALLAATMEE